MGSGFFLQEKNTKNDKFKEHFNLFLLLHLTVSLIAFLVLILIADSHIFHQGEKNEK